MKKNIYRYILKLLTKLSIKLLKRLNEKNVINIKMLKQIVSQLQQMFLKFGLKNGYILTISN